jgi:hypothetical protein
VISWSLEAEAGAAVDRLRWLSLSVLESKSSWFPGTLLG